MIVRITVALPAILLLALLTFGQNPASGTPTGNDTPASDPLKRTTPQSAVAGFLQACRTHDYALACSYLDLRQLPHTARLKEGSEAARQLNEILERDTNFDVAELSTNPNGSGANGVAANQERIDSFSAGGDNAEVDLERVRLRSGVPVWLFSSKTIAQLPLLMRLTAESPVERYLPSPLVNWKVAGTPLWQWLALIALALVTVPVARLVCPLILRSTRPLLRHLVARANLRILDDLVSPLRLLVGVVAFRFGLIWIEPSPQVRLWLGHALALLLMLALFWMFLAAADLALLHLRANLLARHRSFSYSALPLTARVLKIVVFLLLLAALLSEWGYNTTTILAGLGVGGIAIALAAKTTVENFFGGVSIIADRPVSVGDFCKFGDRVGTVEDIGLRSTRIRTPDRTVISVPNGQLSTMTIENYAKRDKMMFHILLNLRQDTKPNQVRALLRSVTQLLKEHDKVDAGAFPVHFVGVGTYSLDVDVFVYILTSDDNEFAEIRQDLLLGILDAVEAAGTSLALPTQASIDYSYSPASDQTSTPSTSGQQVVDTKRQ